MDVNKIMDSERERLNKLQNFRLPNYFKGIGIAIFMASFLMMMGKFFIPDQPEIVKSVARKGLLIGMLLISLSRDKEEDELTVNLRAQSYAIAFITGVIYALIMPYVDYGVSNIVKPEGQVLKELGDFQVLAFMLMVQLAFYHALKRYR